MVKLLSHYVPALPAHLPAGRTIPKLSKRINKTVGEAVEARNRLVHVGAAPPVRASLQDTLDAVADVLYYLDYLSGEAWAAQRLAVQTRTELGI